MFAAATGPAHAARTMATVRTPLRILRMNRPPEVTSRRVSDVVDHEARIESMLHARARDVGAERDHLVADAERRRQRPREVRAPEERAARRLGERGQDGLVAAAAEVLHPDRPAELTELREAARAAHEELRIVARHDPAHATLVQDRAKTRRIRSAHAQSRGFSGPCGRPSSGEAPGSGLASPTASGPRLAPRRPT